MIEFKHQFKRIKIITNSPTYYAQLHLPKAVLIAKEYINTMSRL